MTPGAGARIAVSGVLAGGLIALISNRSLGNAEALVASGVMLIALIGLLLGVDVRPRTRPEHTPTEDASSESDDSPDAQPR